eukprot:scaffold15939_cov123-Amphora_coffeaeformis.AAC.1
MNQEQFKKLTLYQCACCALINDSRAPLQVFHHLILERRRSPDGDEVDPYQWRLACNPKTPLPASEGYYRLYAIDKNGTGDRLGKASKRARPDTSSNSAMMSCSGFACEDETAASTYPILSTPCTDCSTDN